MHLIELTGLSRGDFLLFEEEESSDFSSSIKFLLKITVKKHYD